ncbi:Putative sodium-coupled neutral amino acid transporter 10 [Seminavis robusta]|uniref:Sodium-coupled neutral amino acid transporter 10 n=1 Tax=Seminavis robusta TaxID=568900 RepID=A0A9N8EZJ9_9STRA|nr:Putative sodium-coupled neutral amino acid transporter 10 [Seminavis robusta]|eukprot:Sro2232_g320100.1 Putative sodium-coupled neutral amino acid transporter 10 (503) ;mRNA; f:10998-12506
MKQPTCVLFCLLVFVVVQGKVPTRWTVKTARQQGRQLPTALSAVHAIPRGGGATNKQASTKSLQKDSTGRPTIKANGSNNKASVSTSIFNLANNVAGAGILTLAAGKAVSGTGWIPSLAICLALAFCSAHTFILIGKACEMTNQQTFKGLWGYSFGEKTAWIVDSMVFIQCFFVSIIYTGLLGDIFSALLANVGSINPEFTTRTSIILMAAVAILWPLNMIRDLSALGFTSILGLIAVLYTVFFILYRALDGTYSISEPIGKFVAEGALTALPSFDKSSLWNFDINALVLVSNLGLAFIAHYNGPSYWRSLDKATSARFSKVAMSAYAILALIYTTTMVSGYATFGDACQGNILLNYAASDYLSTLGRLATGFSIIFGFPLISNGAREGLKNASAALGWTSLSLPQNHVPLVTCLLIITTCLSIVLKDIKLVAGLTGAVMGSSLVYICPTLLYARVVRKCHGVDSPEYRSAKRNLLFIPFGLFTASMGVAMTLKNTVLAAKQ